jgi:rSAM/selenodomain-associated transferase 2
MPARLSIVIPALNEAAAIGDTLRALQPMRGRGVEVLVADGGSVDGTPALAITLADRVLSAPRGRARQMNAGAAAASGDVLLFLHADTGLPAAADRLVLDGLADSGRLWGRFDVRIAGRSPWLRVVAHFMNRRSRWTGIATGDQALFVRRETFAALGGFPDQPLMEDVELSSRLRRLGPPLCPGERAVTSGRRWETHGVWRTVFLMWRLRWLYWRGVAAERLAGLYR